MAAPDPALDAALASGDSAAATAALVGATPERAPALADAAAAALAGGGPHATLLDEGAFAWAPTLLAAAAAGGDGGAVGRLATALAGALSPREAILLLTAELVGSDGGVG